MRSTQVATLVGGITATVITAAATAILPAPMGRRDARPVTPIAAHPVVTVARLTPPTGSLTAAPGLSPSTTICDVVRLTVGAAFRPASLPAPSLD